MDKCSFGGCIRLIVRFLRWIPVIFIVCVLTWAYYVYVYHICFGFVNDAMQRVVYLTVFHFLFIFMIWSYFQTVYSSIGHPPASFLLTREVKDDLCAATDENTYRNILERFARQNKIPVLNRAIESGVRFCIKCSSIKPDRCHHCSICSRCILKFDHHCPWVNTCINFRNYKFFVLFLCYGFYLCVFGFFSILPHFVVLWQNAEFGQHGMAAFYVLFLFFVAGMFGISLGCLFIYHLYLTSQNRSTLETFRPPMFHYGVDKNAYNLGIKRNFIEVFGQNKLLWFIPVFTSLGDGIVYTQLSGGGMEASISTTASSNDYQHVFHQNGGARLHFTNGIIVDADRGSRSGDLVMEGTSSADEMNAANSRATFQA